MPKSLKVAVIGAGPAGIYASDILAKSGRDVSIDLFERLPAPYGLVRYGVAPDHPRIKQIIVALYRILQRGDINLYGNVEVGIDVSLEELQDRYDAIIIATGADRDAALNIEGTDLPQSYGAADFVSWYDGHPDYPRTWPLEAKRVAVIGAGNVALDVSRVLAKHMSEMISTEIPPNVAEQLGANPVEEVHIFGRRGPAQVKFTPLELRELGRMADVDVIVAEEDFDFDEGSQKALRASNQQRQVVKTLTSYASADPADHTASRRVYIHMFESPARILADEDGNVNALVTERTRLAGDGNVTVTGETTTWPVEAVYRAVGYYSSPIPGAPFDPAAGIVPNMAGRVVEQAGSEETVPGLYATGWIKRGPVGLIGSTKSDAQETIANVLADVDAGVTGSPTEGDVRELLDERDVPYTDWAGWEMLDAYERTLGDQWEGDYEGASRERVKVVSRQKMTDISRGDVSPQPPTGATSSSVSWENDDHVGTPGEMGKPPATERFADFTGPKR